ncbi:hypothetical protein C5S36_04075, partial [Candidatus Methanophagaceae archaeon]
MKIKHNCSIFFFIGLLLSAPNLIVAQNLPEVIIISDNVGPLIDSTERAAYCLFPEYLSENFNSAQFFKLYDDKIEVVIYLKNNKTYKKIISQELFTEYQKQINKRIINYNKADTSFIYSVLLLDETKIYGTFEEIKEKEIVLITNYSDTLIIPKIKILKIEKKMSISDSKNSRWFENPHDTRHFFAPTARSLQKGEGYFQDIYLFIAAGNYGITDNITIGGGFSIVPFIDIDDQIFFLTPKIGFQLKEKFSLGGGVLYANTPAVNN